VLGAIRRVPLNTALDGDEAAAWLLHCYPGRRRRGLLAVAPASNSCAGLRNSRCPRHPEARRPQCWGVGATQSPWKKA